MADLIGGESPLSFLDELPEICVKCNFRFSILFGHCDFCYVEDEYDTDFIIRDDR